MLSCCWQNWKSGLDEPSGDTQRHQRLLGLSQCHTAVQSLERLQNSHRAAVQLPTLRGILPSSILFSACLYYDKRSISPLPSTSTITYFSHGAQTMSISAPHAHYTSSLLSVPAKAICWALLTASAPAPPFHVLTLIGAFLHSKAVSRIF